MATAGNVHQENKSFWEDFQELPIDTIGYFVEPEVQPTLIEPNVHLITEHLQRFLEESGFKVAKAIPIPPPVQAGGMGELPLPPGFVFGPAIFALKFITGWKNRLDEIKRRSKFKRIKVVIFADHLPRVWSLPHIHNDSARTLCPIIPELQESLEKRFPTFLFEITILANAKNISRVIFRFGHLKITNQNVNQMIKIMNKDENMLTLYQTQGLFGQSVIKKICGKSLTQYRTNKYY